MSEFLNTVWDLLNTPIAISILAGGLLWALRGRTTMQGTSNPKSGIKPRMIIVLAAVLAASMIPVAVLAAGGTFTDDEDSIFESDIGSPWKKAPFI